MVNEAMGGQKAGRGGAERPKECRQSCRQRKAALRRGAELTATA